jgi:serine-type D-Ala-D-Ala carboxypeptidase/endopeptidase (penicillin-binding protein 4)
MATASGYEQSETMDWTNTDHGDANAIPGATLTAEDPLAGIKELARQVRSGGITEVQGNVAFDDRLFTANFEPQPTPVMINDNLIDIVTTPTDATVKTVAVGQPTAITIVGSAPGAITVTGTIAAGSATLVRVAPITDPAAFARTAFIEALRAAGVQIDAVAIGENPKKLLPPSSTYPDSSRVAAYVSPPYSEYAKLILKVSHNLGANLGLCLLAVHAKSADGNAGFALLKDFLTAAKVDVAQLAMSDAEGGPADRATLQTFAQILRYWTKQKDFDAFRACLPILGTDGSLSSVAVDSLARGKVFAKTGTNVGFDPLGQRLLVQSKALAGFFQRVDGQWQVFNVVVNDAGGAPDISAVLSANEDVGEVATQLWKEANPAGR